METKELVGFIALAVIIALGVSLATVNMTGDVAKISGKSISLECRDFGFDPYNPSTSTDLNKICKTNKYDTCVSSFIMLDYKYSNEPIYRSLTVPLECNMAEVGVWSEDFGEELIRQNSEITESELISLVEVKGTNAGVYCCRVKSP